MTVFKDRFAGKTMLVTGGTSGIGKAACLRAGAEGANVVVVGRNAQRGQAVVDEIVQGGGKAIFMAADMTSEASIMALFEQIDALVGPVDLAVNNAGVVGHGERIDEMPTEEWNRVINTNLSGVFFCCREESKRMIARGQGGAIVNVASVAGLTGFYRATAYVASKHAVNGLTKAMASDLAPFNIRVNSINPANTTTPLTDASAAEVKAKLGAAMASGKSLDEAKADTMIGGKTMALIKRNSEPEEQAAAILYLLSDDASFITGAAVGTDGGFTSY
ncbi:short chain dehydrogenase [Oscillospiraceae bacterium]|nr:short chain dehydrogenase [Oscillospiraceae bacterium]BDF74512.1 short chain dehydrogenase [Oscillospiraceae bacterium]